MANRCFLTASNVKSIYPSFADVEYCSENQTIANDVEYIPLLWLALFREEDLENKKFDIDGEEVNVTAPLCTKQKALKQLRSSVNYLCKIFPNFDNINDYAKMLEKALNSVDYKYISIELQEIAELYPAEHRFQEILKLSLKGFENPNNITFYCDDVELNIWGEKMVFKGFKADSHAGILEKISFLKTNIKLPSVNMYIDDLPYTEDEQWNFTRIFGAGKFGSLGYGREVPWEKEDADYGWAIQMP